MLDTLPPSLLDRCEVIRLSGYTHDEKLHIARCYLLSKQLAQNRLSDDHVRLIVLAFLRVVTDYTRDAGVHALERDIGGVACFKAVGSTAHVDTRGYHLGHGRRHVMCWTPTALRSNVSGMATLGTIQSLMRISLKRSWGYRNMTVRTVTARQDTARCRAWS